MILYQQNEKDIIDPETEMHYAILSSFQDTKFPHSHDFFEVFLLVEGTQLYITKGQEMTLQPGALVLVRPNEVHSRAYLQPGWHINVAFSTQIANAMFNYLSEGYPAQKLLDKNIIPYLILNEAEKQLCQRQLEELKASNYADNAMLRTKLRIAIMELFTHYFYAFINQDEKQLDIPPSFLSLINSIERYSNFVIGMEKLLELSPYSHEHLCRLFKTYLSCTPTQYITELRLNYVVNDLTYSDRSIIDIAYNAGFDNISHFYRVFKNKFGTSPAKFRKTVEQKRLYL